MYFSKNCLIQELVSNFCRTTCVSLSFTSYNNCKFCNIIFYNILFQNTLDISLKKIFENVSLQKQSASHFFPQNASIVLCKIVVQSTKKQSANAYIQR